MHLNSISAKIKNTLLALTVAASIVGFGYGVGEPTLPLSAGLAAAPAPVALSVVEAQPASATDSRSAMRHSQRLKRHLTMPFVSFAPLLSRRGT